MLGDAFLKTVKAVLVELLSKVLNLYSKEICCGCQVNHPSQIQHKCLGEIQDYFYLMHYEELTKRLWRDRFVPTIQRAPQSRRLCVSEALKALKQAEDFWLGESR